jgi:hypothetical protein
VCSSDLGKVFIVYSAKSGNKKEIVNKNVLLQIKAEIERLRIKN